MLLLDRHVFVKALLLCTLVFLMEHGRGEPVINEIHYHPEDPEDVGLEFIEIYNAGESAIEMNGWRLRGGVDFEFPDMRLPPGNHLVVAADPERYRGDPDLLVVGPWLGRLSNRGERIRLIDSLGREMDDVAYADEGDWAPRVRGPEDLGHRGWIWENAHDGEGSSLELIQPSLSNRRGGNWSASFVKGGTPGRENSVSRVGRNAPPVISEINHVPTIPGPEDVVTVSARVEDESRDVLVSLFYRSGSGSEWQRLTMRPGRGHGRFEGEVPPHADGEVVQFYVEASDGEASRRYPNPEAPGLYQVEVDFDAGASWVAGQRPLYRVIMTEEERRELAQIGSERNEAESNAQMNATFIAEDGAGLRTHYLVGVRNRGASSRLGPPNNALVLFRSDDLWRGADAVKFNVRAPFSQTIGSVLFRRAGVPVARAVPARLWINGEELESGGYAQVETFGERFLEQHFPVDPGGNLYQVRDDVRPGDLTYLGSDPVPYAEAYYKQSNEDENDYSDIIGLTQALNEVGLNDEAYITELEKVMDIEQWLHVLAVDTLLGNREGGLTSGKGDDYALYRGVSDPRFRLVPHDLDTVLGIGRTPAPDRSIWSYAEVEGLQRFFAHPEIRQRYLSAVDSALREFYTEEIIEPLIDQVLGDWVPGTIVESMKGFSRNRRQGVLEQLATEFTVEADLALRLGRWWTDESEVDLSGSFPAVTAASVRVAGEHAAVIDAIDGQWELENLALGHGINRVLVEAYSKAGGRGVLVAAETVEIWYEESPLVSGMAVGGMLQANVDQGDVEKARLNVSARDSYYPGVPILVRAALEDESGNYRRDLWDATVKLSTDREDVLVEPEAIQLRNGVGSALVTVKSASGGQSTDLVPRGSEWRYLDDGSDQGESWIALPFDDSSWARGEAELGYGDGDEATELGFGDDEDDKHATTYFRKLFQVEALGELATLTLHLKYDDAAAVYLNGEEVVRTANLAGDAAFDDYAMDDVEDEDRFEVFDVPLGLLQEGQNVLAVEVHQGDGQSSDISMDAQLVARGVLQDAGDFTLVAETLGLHVATEALSQRLDFTSLAEAPVVEVSGTLSGDQSTWNGVVVVPSDLEVPSGHRLTIEAGTLVLLEGTSTPLDENGVDIDIRGSIDVQGTSLRPVTFTARDPRAPWGEIHHHDSDATSMYRHTLITRAGHAPRGGHTNTGPAFNIDASEVQFADIAVSDIAGKIMEVHDSALSFHRCHFSRAAMGPEIDDTGVLMEACTITEMLGDYREDGITDDNDGLYLHGAGSGQVIEVNDLVVAHTDDDGFDTLNAETVLRHSVLRDCADKGASINGGHATIERCLVVGNRYGVQGKSNGVELTIDHSTLVDNQTSLLVLDEPDDINVSNSILWALDPETEFEGRVDRIAVTYCLSHEVISGTGNLAGDPAFSFQSGHDYRPLPDSPAKDAASPLSPADADGSPADIGYAVALDEVPLGAGTVTWRASDGPIRVLEDLVVPDRVTLVVEPGAVIYVSPGKTVTVNGVLRAEGTPWAPIQWTSDPALPWVDDIRPGLPQGPPRWGGIRFVDSMSPENRVSHVHVGYAQNAMGSIGIIRSQVLVDHCTFEGTHLRMIYADSSSVIIEHCVFPDMFAPNERADALGLDNISEHIKGIGKYPPDGHFIIRQNVFGTNKGHNDIIDVDSGIRPEPILQIIGNEFAGAGDELVDLGGDVYLAENVFYNVFKDDETSDRGYANAISTGDAVSQATIVATRNVFWDVDHAINLKRNVATIFEYNTVYQVHGDFDDRFGNPNVGSVVNLYVDEPGATPGDGAFLYGNILMSVPRIFGNADRPGERLSPLGLAHNWVDEALTDLTVGSRVGTVFQLGKGNILGSDPFMEPDAGVFALTPHAGARGAGPMGEDLGMTVRPGIHIAGEPVGTTGQQTVTLTLTLGGPGLFAYRYRVNGGSWSGPRSIGDGFAGPETERLARLVLSDLVPGEWYQVEAVGQDFAGNWQLESEATRSKTWRVREDGGGWVQINEVLAINRASPEVGDYVELWNPSDMPVALGGWILTDDPGLVGGHLLAEGTILEAGAYLVVPEAELGFGLDGGGETLSLLDTEGVLVDAVSFGRQSRDLAMGRTRSHGGWHSVKPSMGGPNERLMLADAGRVRIHEWLGASAVRVEEDFVELANLENLPVDLSGWSIGDRAGKVIEFPERSYLGAESAWAIGGVDVDRLQDTLYLRDPSGEVVDFVLTETLVTDRSYGREGEVADVPTPGWLGQEVDAGQMERLRALLDGLRITEILYHPSGGDETLEFIEVENVGDEFLDLAGVRFIEGVRFAFPPDSLLAPGDQLVVAADHETMRRVYGGDVPLAGVYEGRLSNGGENLVLALPEPFDVAILRFRYRDDWWPITDGGGFSLMVDGQASLGEADPANWNDPFFWTASAFPGGDPGGVRAIEAPVQGYAAWSASYGLADDVHFDSDGDGLSDLEEYARDLDPTQIDREEPFAFRRAEDGENFLLQTNLVERSDLSVMLQASSDLKAWTDVGELVLPLGEVIVRLGDELENLPKYVRLSFDLRP